MESLSEVVLEWRIGIVCGLGLGFLLLAYFAFPSVVEIAKPGDLSEQALEDFLADARVTLAQKELKNLKCSIISTFAGFASVCGGHGRCRLCAGRRLEVNVSAF